MMYSEQVSLMSKPHPVQPAGTAIHQLSSICFLLWLPPCCLAFAGAHYPVCLLPVQLPGQLPVETALHRGQKPEAWKRLPVEATLQREQRRLEAQMVWLVEAALQQTGGWTRMAVLLMQLLHLMQERHLELCTEGFCDSWLMRVEASWGVGCWAPREVAWGVGGLQANSCLAMWLIIFDRSSSLNILNILEHSSNNSKKKKHTTHVVVSSIRNAPACAMQPA